MSKTYDKKIVMQTITAGKTSRKKATQVLSAMLPRYGSRYGSSHGNDLDFIETSRHARLLSRSALALVATLAVVLLLYYLSLQHAIDAQQAANPALLTERDRSTPHAATLPAQYQAAYQNAQQTRAALNVPWLQSLAALEAVQAASPAIYLFTIQPNRARSEILLSGQTPDFASLDRYLNLLQKQALFGDATLLNQRLVDDGNAIGQLAFTISVAWR